MLGQEDAATSKPAAFFFETFEQKRQRLRDASADGSMPSWGLESFIVKESDDVRQDQLAVQLLSLFLKVCRLEGVPIWLKPYTILVTGTASGLVETLFDAVSLHALKSKAPGFTNLSRYFVDMYGPSTCERHRKSLQNFVRSMAGYSVATYLLLVKDRHNGNIMLDAEGHIVHIDYGFLLGLTPGDMGWENAPFKLTAEMVDVMGGWTGSAFAEYRRLCMDAFVCLRRQCDNFVALVELMARDSSLPCFQSGVDVVGELRRRFLPDASEAEARAYMSTLVTQSYSSWRTGQYDTFQRLSNGILP